MKIKFKKLHDNAQLPVYAHGADEDAGMDLKAVEDFVLRPNVPTMVSCGFAIELPPGYEGQIRPRSGLASKYGITIPNSPGTVDPSYRGEIKVLLQWIPGPTMFTQLEFKAGERIAQLVIAKYEAIEWEEGEELANSTRGIGGFGSTGTK